MITIAPAYAHCPKLREFFDSHYVPQCLEDPSSRNVEGYSRALDLWEVLTPNPPIIEITAQTLSDFKTRLMVAKWRGRTISVNTVRKHLSHVQWILDQAGPPSNRGSLKTAAGLVDRVPFTKIPKRRETFQRETPIEHVVAFWHVLDKARFPIVGDIPPGDMWRALLALMCSTSLRIGQCVELPTWTQEGRTTIDWEGRRLMVPHQICRKSKKDEPKPLHEFAIQSLAKIRDDRRDLLLPFFPALHSKTTIYTEAHRLQDLAHVPRFAFHGMRRNVITALSDISPAAAQLAAGHSSYQTTKIYQDLRLLTEAVDQLPIWARLAAN